MFSCTSDCLILAAQKKICSKVRALGDRRAQEEEGQEGQEGQEGEQSGIYDPGGRGMLVSANFGRLVLGCIAADFCK